MFKKKLGKLKKFISNTLVVSMTISSLLLTTTVSAATTSLELKYQCGDAANGNAVKPYISLINNGTSSVALSDIKVRYWYTKDSSVSENFVVDYSPTISASNITGAFEDVTNGHYLETGFATVAGNLAVGGNTGTLKLRANKSDWSNYTQTDDYSFDATKTSLADWTKITVYYQGQLVWGTEPGAVTNHAPVLNTIGSKSVVAASALTFTVSATDADSDTLTYSASGLPTGATFNTSTKTFTWTPTISQVGSYTPTFTVSDGQVTDSETPTITVTSSASTNNAPVINTIGSKSVVAASALTFVVSATDSDGDELTYSANGLPTGATFNTSTKTFTWTPTTSQVGSYTPTFTVSDGQVTDSETPNITVAAQSSGTKIICSTVAQIQTALTNAAPGDDIVIKAGTYTGAKTTLDGKSVYFNSANNGTSAKHITIESEDASNPAVLSGSSITSAGYALYITGDYWDIKNLKVTGAQKGIVLDNSNHSLIYGCEVYGVGQEGIHLRDGSSNCIVDSCNVHDTGTGSSSDKGYGEGIYVGSDNGSWSSYAYACDNNIIQNCSVGYNVAAECIDVKEGTQNTVIQNCIFDGSGMSGVNSSDDMVALKGANAVLYNNLFNQNGNSIISDAIHLNNRGTVYSGTGTGIYYNTFNMDSATEYLVQSKQGACTYKVWGNTRNPAGNTWGTNSGTTFTSTNPGSSWPQP
ncbi:putative Ig domain-containing protein [Clostridium lacusfryxellense]|uniref:putative Ig domain-containing protein n=1 Tax=Clostridium lacusfryxellense TaxID=205328 RepID=UPI001C0B9443|nr:putative Ig domain-containing protein [Clostridium lacusfryxellense]MBU3110063.1 putative Ig domain-containing protein [Clostridium lacusfryxellense]